MLFKFIAALWTGGHTAAAISEICSLPPLLSSVFVPDLVHGSGVVERLRDVVQARDPAVLPETPGHHGQHGQRSELQGEDHN